MAYINQVEPEQATGALRQVYDAAVARAGGIANIIRIMSQDGRSTLGSMNFYVSLMKAPNALAPARREMLATVVSNINACYY